MSESTSNIEVKSGSARSFGLVFGFVALAIGLYPMAFSGGPRIWCLAIAAALVVVAFVYPKILETPNRLWFRFGMLLGAIVAPIVMGVIYLLVITPFGVVMRLLGKKPLDLALDPDAKTYWITREDDDQSSMRNQF